MFDNPRSELDWLEDELLDEELEEILYGSGEDDEEYDEYDDGEYGNEEYDEDDAEAEYAQAKPRSRRREKKRRRTVYPDEDDEERYMLLPKRKGIKGLVFLAVLELIGILAIIGWWLQWLI